MQLNSLPLSCKEDGNSSDSGFSIQFTCWQVGFGYSV